MLPPSTLREQPQAVEVGLAVLGDVPHAVDARLRHVVGHRGAAVRGERGDVHLRLRHARAGRDVAEELAAFSLAVARSMSPASTSTALFGPYQVRNQVFTSSSEAAVEVVHRPMVLWWYGWPAGYIALPMASHTWP